MRQTPQSMSRVSHAAEIVDGFGGTSLHATVTQDGVTAGADVLAAATDSVGPFVLGGGTSGTLRGSGDGHICRFFFFFRFLSTGVF